MKKLIILTIAILISFNINAQLRYIECGVDLTDTVAAKSNDNDDYLESLILAIPVDDSVFQTIMADTFYIGDKDFILFQNSSGALFFGNAGQDIYTYNINMTNQSTNLTAGPSSIGAVDNGGTGSGRLYFNTGYNSDWWNLIDDEWYNDYDTLSTKNYARSVSGGGTQQLANLTIIPIDEGSPAGDTRGNNAVDLQTYRSLSSYAATSNASVISGGRNNSCTGIYTVVSGGYSNSAAAMASSISGGQGNNITSIGTYSSINGGINNSITSTASSINGGQNNSASGSHSFVGGGRYVSATGMYSSYIGGYTGASQTYGEVVGGLFPNAVSGDDSLWVGNEPIFRIGNGTDNTHRGDAIRINKNGDVFLVGDSVYADTTVFNVQSIGFPDGTYQTTAPTGGSGDVSFTDTTGINKTISTKYDDDTLQANIDIVQAQVNDTTYGVAEADSNSVYVSWYKYDSTVVALNDSIDDLRTTINNLPSGGGNDLMNGLICSYSMYSLLDTIEIDQSGNTNDLELEGGVEHDSIGRLGRCYSFDGTDDYLGSLSIMDEQSFTVSAWFKTYTDAQQTIIGNQGYSGGYVGWNIFVDNEFTYRGEVTVWLNIGGVAQQIHSGVAVDDGNWHNVTLTVTSGNQYIYIDGVQASSTTHTGTVSYTAGDFEIGRNASDGWYFDGLIDEVDCYDRVLTASERNNLRRLR